MFARIVLLVASLSIPGALHAEGVPAEKAGFESRLTIYLAKGAPDACGPGCDRWIAIEGEVDQDAGPRIRRFLAGVKDVQRPIYLHSPGGNVEQSYVIGRLLRSRKAVARVGRTIATACAAGTQVDAACLKIKNAGGEVEAELTTRNAMCNSACGYLFLGATSREVAPDAAMAVHNSRLMLVIHGHPPAKLVADARQRQIETSNRARAAFVAAMGISHELDDLIRTVKFESPHTLTRPELRRFGIDKRTLAETMWTLEKGERPSISKFAMMKKENGSSFRMMEWRLSCESKDRVPLRFAAEIDETAVGKSTMLMAANTDTKQEAGGFPLRVGKYEVWSGALGSDMLKAMLASRRLQGPRNHADAGRKAQGDNIRHRDDESRTGVAAARGGVHVGHGQREESVAGKSVAGKSVANKSVADKPWAERQRNASGHAVVLAAACKRTARARALATRNREADMHSALAELLLLTRADPGLSTVDK